MFALRYFAARFFPKRYFPEVGSSAPPTTDTSGIDVTDAQRSPMIFASVSRPVIVGKSRSLMGYDTRRLPMHYADSTVPVIYHRGKP